MSVSLELGVDLLHEAIAAVIRCASRETRPHLRGVYVELEPVTPATVRLTTVATNGHMLARWTRDLDADAESMQTTTGVLIPLTAAKGLQRQLKGATWACEVRVGDDATLRIRIPGAGESLIQGSPERFPPWRQVIPRTEEHTHVPEFFTVDARYLADAAQCFAVRRVGRAAVRGVRLQTGNNRAAYAHLQPVTMTAETFPELLVIVMPIRSDATPRSLPLSHAEEGTCQ